MKRRAQTLSTPEGGLDFTIVHRSRVKRRLHLELDEAGALVVVAPRDWPDFYTRRLLRRNLAHVHRFLRRARNRQWPALDYVSGELHLVEGREFPLRVIEEQRRGARVRFADEELVVRLAQASPERVRAALRRWYRERAARLFKQRLDTMRAGVDWARDRDLDLQLRRMTRTWGTCRSNGVIRLNTHLVKAPVDCIDYVISHELCHLEEMNHGPRFYELQERLWPQWRSYRRHLRDHGGRYTRE